MGVLQHGLALCETLALGTAEGGGGGGAAPSFAPDAPLAAYLAAARPVAAHLGAASSDALAVYRACTLAFGEAADVGPEAFFAAAKELLAALVAAAARR